MTTVHCGVLVVAVGDLHCWAIHWQLMMTTVHCGVLVVAAGDLHCWAIHWQLMMTTVHCGVLVVAVDYKTVYGHFPKIIVYPNKNHAYHKVVARLPLALKGARSYPCTLNRLANTQKGFHQWPDLMVELHYAFTHGTGLRPEEFMSQFAKETRVHEFAGTHENTSKDFERQPHVCNFLLLPRILRHCHILRVISPSPTFLPGPPVKEFQPSGNFKDQLKTCFKNWRIYCHSDNLRSYMGVTDTEPTSFVALTTKSYDVLQAPRGLEAGQLTGIILKRSEATVTDAKDRCPIPS
ncbi:hypothetical protein J6590_016560 [Homalodisca vitripennis]|nr:hypothetical protein J6590_016560 [Homalodisca vitripennis]